MRYNHATLPYLPLIIRKLFYSICVWNMTPDEKVRVQVFKTRTKEL